MQNIYFRRAAGKILLVLVLTSATILSDHAIAGTPPPPPPGTATTGGGHGSGGNKGPSEAPVGNGIGLLMLLGAAYAGGRIYMLRQKEVSEA